VFVRAAAVPAASAALVILAAAAASAHVTVHSKDAKPGGTNATLVFKVPNEEDNAKTTKIEIDLPTATPLTGVTAAAPTGWTSQVTADKIVYSGGSISGDDSVQFPVKVAQLPKVNEIVFKAIQTYSNGDVVRWIEQAPEGAPDPAHPAPTLNLLDPSKLSADEIADAKEDAEKDAKAKAAAASPAKAGGATPAKVHAGTGGQAVQVAIPMHGADGDNDSAAKAPAKVKAGTGGQASEGSTAGVPVVPLGILAAGVAVAGLAGRRLVRR
jgi:uncharacterized protein YcnI